MNRRHFLAGFGSALSAIAGCTGGKSEISPGVQTKIVTKTEFVNRTVTDPPRPTDTPTPFTNFVKVDGEEFIVDGNPQYFVGGNHPQLRRHNSNEMSIWFDQWLSIAPDLNALRATAFGSGERSGLALQLEPGRYSELAFRHLDELIYQAEERGVRLILPLTNNWEWGGGMPQYVEWADDASEHDDFYTNEQIRDWYMDYLTYVLNRENTRTGVQYKNDPTIMMWELANEPYAEDLSKLVDWASEMSSHIKSIGENQLVSTGMGGLGGPDFRSKFGNIYREVNKLPNIDAYSIHIWVDPVHLDLGKEGGMNTIINHTMNAHEKLDMPIYVGEFGWEVDRNDDEPDPEEIQERNDVFGSWYATMNDEGTNGGLVWDLRHKLEYDRVTDWNRYAVFPRDEGTPAIIRNAAETFASKS